MTKVISALFDFRGKKEGKNEMHVLFQRKISKLLILFFMQ